MRKAAVGSQRALGTRLLSSASLAVDAVDPALLGKFEVKERVFLKEHAVWAALLRHRATGGELLSIEADANSGGDEKVFGVAFATESGDSTGVAHILEHSVLCGSEKYPCKEPFAVLLRSSMQTFLNAMTYPDRTVYPVASLNEKDFRNLVGVYLDAVFRPRLSRFTLMQEGWRVEPAEDDAAGTHRFSGVVYSEMKGVYSSADSLHSMACGQALFPNSFYGVSSGGDPAAIPTLTYEEFIAFHRRNYRPEHAKLYFWGDDDVAERLRVADEYLSRGNIHDEEQYRLGAGDALPSSMTPPEAGPCWWPPADADAAPAAAADRFSPTAYAPAAPGTRVPVPSDAPAVRFAHSGGARRIRVQYPSATGGQGDEEGGGGHASDAGHFVTVCWALQDGGVKPGESGYVPDVDRLGLQVLSSLLMGSRESPLYRKLADSGLGTAVTGMGLSQYLRQGVFEAGIKGITPDGSQHASEGELTDSLCEQVEGMVSGVLRSVEADGFKQSHLRSELNKLEFAIREFGAGGSPKGLTLFLGAVGPWIYGRDPIEDMQYAEALVELRSSLESDSKAFFSRLIRTHLLDNEHTVTVHSAPSTTLAEDLTAAESAAVSSAVAAMSDEEQASLATAATTLQARQAAPDTPEALATVPQLHRSDLKREATEIVRDARVTDDAMVIASALPSTNGISHISVSVDMGWALPAELVQWAPLFAELLTSTGTADHDEEATSHRIGEHTGGVSAGIHASPVPGSRRLAQVTMTIGGKALGPTVPELAAILIDLLRTAPLAKRPDILLKHVREGIAGLEGGIGSAGHRHSMMAANAQLSLPGEISYAMAGYPQLRFLRQLRKRLESDSESERQSAVGEAEEAMERLRSIVLAARSPSDSSTHTKPLVSVAAGPDDVEAAIEAGLLVAAATRSSGVDSSGVTPLPPALASPSAVPAAGSLHARGSYIHADAFSPLAAQGLPGGFVSSQPGMRQALIVPSSVAYVASAGIGFAHGQPLSSLPQSASHGMLQPDQILHPSDHPSALVDFATPSTASAASSMLGMGHLWERIRVQSNAYGAGCSVDPVSGGIGFWSYRDPRIAGTLADYSQSAQWLRAADGGMDQAAIDGTVITAVAALDKPLAPAEKAGQSATRWSLGLKQEQVQARRDALLAMGPEDVEAFAEAVECSQSGGQAVCAVVGREMAEAEGITDAQGAALDGWQVIDVFGGERS